MSLHVEKHFNGYSEKLTLDCNALSGSKPLNACSKNDFINFRKYCHSEYFRNRNIDIKNDFMTLLISYITNGIQFEISYTKTRKNNHV